MLFWRRRRSGVSVPECGFAWARQRSEFKRLNHVGYEVAATAQRNGRNGRSTDIEHGGAAEWIRSTFQYAAEEVAVGRPGSETVLAKLSELLFVEAVRRYAEALPEGQTGWLARALALLHRDITRRWTVDDLGREVGLSRSALADRSFV